MKAVLVSLLMAMMSSGAASAGAPFACNMGALSKPERAALELSANDGSLWLSLTGDEGIKPFIRAEFQLEP